MERSSHARCTTQAVRFRRWRGVSRPRRQPRGARDRRVFISEIVLSGSTASAKRISCATASSAGLGLPAADELAGGAEMWHTFRMAHKRYTVHVGERGRVVLPAEVRRTLNVNPGDLLSLDLDESDQTLQVRTAVDVARSSRGLLRDLVPGVDLAAELIDDRREEAAREDAADSLAAER
jgi:AbrB family looped-hinge helix DNA binding protein